MQRRKVLLPEPEGPTMPSTSFGDTSRSMPWSTSSRPKLLCTASAFTMGATLMSSMPPGERHRYLHRRRRRCMESEQHPPEPLKWGERRASQRAASKMSLDVILANRKNRRHHQVPDAGHDQQFEDVVGRGRNLLLACEQLCDRGREGE